MINGIYIYGNELARSRRIGLGITARMIREVIDVVDEIDRPPR